MSSPVSVESTAQYGELIKGVGVKFMEVYNQSLMSYSNATDEIMGVPGNKATLLFKTTNTGDKVVHFLQKTGVGYLQHFAEGEAIPQDSRILGYKTSVTPQFDGSSVQVTMAALKTRDYQAQLDEFGDLTIASKESVDKSAFDVFNYAFTAQSSLPSNIFGYGDGKPMCSTLHPRKDGGSAQSNASATGVTFTDDNVEIGRIALLRAKDDRGKPISGGSGKLILLVPEELAKAAKVLAQTDRKIETANNNINVYDGIFTVVVSKLLTSSTAWFLIDPKLAKLKIVEHEMSKTHTHTDPHTLTQHFYIYNWYALAWCDWRGIWGSKGDGAAYAL